MCVVQFAILEVVNRRSYELATHCQHQYHPLTLFRMTQTKILAAIDFEIARLKQARVLLLEDETPAIERKKPGPKPGSKRIPHSEEARAKIAAAQKRRWAKQKSE